VENAEIFYRNMRVRHAFPMRENGIGAALMKQAADGFKFSCEAFLDLFCFGFKAQLLEDVHGNAVGLAHPRLDGNGEAVTDAARGEHDFGKRRGVLLGGDGQVSADSGLDLFGKIPFAQDAGGQLSVSEAPVCELTFFEGASAIGVADANLFKLRLNGNGREHQAEVMKQSRGETAFGVIDIQVLSELIGHQGFGHASQVELAVRPLRMSVQLDVELAQRNGHGGVADPRKAKQRDGMPHRVHGATKTIERGVHQAQHIARKHSVFLNPAGDFAEAHIITGE